MPQPSSMTPPTPWVLPVASSHDPETKASESAVESPHIAHRGTGGGGSVVVGSLDASPDAPPHALSSTAITAAPIAARPPRRNTGWTIPRSTVGLDPRPDEVDAAVGEREAGRVAGCHRPRRCGASHPIGPSDGR